MEINLIEKLLINESEAYPIDVMENSFREDRYEFKTEQVERIRNQFTEALMFHGAEAMANELITIMQNHNKMVKMLTDVELAFSQASRYIEEGRESMQEISDTIKNRTHIAGQ